MKQSRGHVVWWLLGLGVLVLVVLVVLQKRGAAQRSELTRQAAEQLQQEELARKAAADQRLLFEERQRKEREQDPMAGAVAKMDALVLRWQDARKVAGSTARVGLAGPIGVMQEVRRELVPLTVPPCLDTGKATLLKSMDATIQAFLTFSADSGPLASIDAAEGMKRGDELIEVFRRERGLCPAG